jgi:hypothetical protein
VFNRIFYTAYQGQILRRPGRMDSDFFKLCSIRLGLKFSIYKLKVFCTTYAFISVVLQLFMHF